MIALVLLLAAAPDHAALVEQALEAEAALEYGTAAVHWESAVQMAPDEATKIEDHLRAGIARRIVGDDAMARLHFIYVLRRQPARTLDADQPPRILDFFELVRDEVRPAPAPTPAPPGPDDAPPPAPPPVVAPGAASGGAWWGVGVSGGLAIAAAMGGAVAGFLAVEADRLASAERVQVERAAVYDQRDDLALVANGLYGAAALGAVVATGFLIAAAGGQ
jgi:hypothetical protein